MQKASASKTINRPAVTTVPAAAAKAARKVSVQPDRAVLVQGLLKVSSPHDPAEREAEVTAKRVMRMAAPDVSHRVPPQAAAKADGPLSVSGRTASEIRSSTTGGSPLPAGVRAFMEPRFRADFRGVKIHKGEKAARLNRKLNAQAFTVGKHVFFGRNRFRPDSHDGREMIAHELTHTIQQGATVQRSADPRVSQRSSGFVQRLGISDALDRFADEAYYIPGFRMFTIILGRNPINMERVDRNAANIMRAVVEFMPGGRLITQALDNYGVFDKVGRWVERQINSLGMTWRAIKDAIYDFLDSLSWTDIFDLGGVWNRAKRIITGPIDRIISFVEGLVTGIIEFIKDAILRPLASLAESTPGYDLLKAVLGRDPITGDPVPRTAETLIGGFMKLIGQEEVWENLKRSNAVARAWAWFQGALASLMGFVRQIPDLFIAALTALELTDIVLLPRAFRKVASVFGGFIGNFISWAGQTVWNLLEIIFAVVAPGVMPYLRRAGGAFRTILNNPVGFIRNLVRAGLLGFRQFARNIGRHLTASIIGWLTGTLAGTGIYIPQALELREIIKFVLSVLGLTWQNIRRKLVRVLGETTVKALETTLDIVVSLVREGPAAAWEKIKEHLTNLRDMVMGEIMSFVTRRVVQSAVTKIASMLTPAGAVIQAIIAIYNTIMFFVERLRQIMQVGRAVIDSISAIAAGVITAAANRVEHTLAGLLTLAISFLARLVGLGRVGDAVKNIVNRIRVPIDHAIDRVIEWIVDKARKLAGRLLGGNPNAPAQERLRNGMAEAMAAVNRFAGRRVGAVVLRPILAAIKLRHGFTRLDVVPAGQYWAVEGTVNPNDRRQSEAKRVDEKAPDGSSKKPFPITWPKRPAASYPKIWLAPRDRVTGRTPQSVIMNIPGAEEYIPTGRKRLPGSTTEIGVTGNWRTAIGKVVGPKLKGPFARPQVRRFNAELKKHGYDRSAGPTDGDHVVELQVSGIDHYDNLWPLDSSENQSGGRNLNNKEVTLPDGTKKRVANLLGMYFKITGFDR